jgi:nucleotide-binding universal stress UspA family protein
MTVSPQRTTSDVGAGPLFARVLCGVDGSPAAGEAARQAAFLAAGGALDLVAVTWTTGSGPTRMTVLSDTRARAALDEAAAMVAELGVAAATEIVHDADQAGTLRRRGAAHDLIAVGARPGSRAGGIMLGSVASAMVHAVPVPVLVARRPPVGSAFPGPIVLATDGSPSSSRAATLAARIAGRFGAAVIMLHVGTADRVEALRAIARQTADVIDATGREPAVAEIGGRPVDTITDITRSEQAALVVLGSRGRKGVKALASVSERVAHEAPCSVLVAR